MRLVLLKHTQTAAGSSICYGDDDVDLADSHREDIANCVQTLPSDEHIITSPLTRCHDLAVSAATRLGVSLSIDHRLKEMHFGRWQGCAWDDVPRGELDEWVEDYECASPHGGELLTTVVTRFVGGGRIMLVTHAGVIRSILALADPEQEGQRDERHFRIDYGQWLEVDYRGTEP